MISRARKLFRTSTLLKWFGSLFKRQKSTENRHVRIPMFYTTEFFGICGPNRKGAHRFVIPLVFCTIFTTIPLVISLINENSTNDFMKKAGFSVLLISASVNFSVIAWKKETLDRLVLNLETFFQTASTDENSEENKKIIESATRRVNVINRWMSIYYGIPAYIRFVAIPMIYTIANYILSPESAVVLTSIDMGPDDFYFDYTSSIWRVLLFYVFQYPATSFLYVIILYDSFFLSLIAVYCLPTLKITVNRLKKMNEQDQAPPSASQISKIIRSHNAALECVRLLEDLVHIIFLCHRLTFLFMWCFVLFGVATYSDSFSGDKIFAFLLSASLKVLAMSFIGKNLNELAEQLVFEVYNIRWYEISNDNKKSVLLMLQQAQTPVGLTAGKFGYVNMESFAKMMQTAYSFYLCLKSALE